MFGKIRSFNVLQSPYIKVKSEVIMPGEKNGMPTIKDVDKYIVAPSAKKIATYIVNQIFGSELVTQTDGLNVNWLMPTLKKALERAIYEEESFVYLHKYDEKVYLENLHKTDLFDLKQEYDKVIHCKIIQDYDEYDDYDYSLEREIDIENGTSTIKFKAFKKSKKSNEYLPINLETFNSETNHDYKRIYILPYEVIINIDLGMKFFSDSEKFLNGEMEIVNVIAEEIEKTKTRIVTTQHYQSGDLVSKWSPVSTNYEIKTVEVNHLQDFFTLLPGDLEHQMFHYLQGDIRIKEYIETFKFYDYQCIQNAGLSPASFGYEKDSYMNVANIDLSKNASDMSVEAIEAQIEPQLNKLFENIIKLQRSQEMVENVLPADLTWDYGNNEKLDDMKKIQVLRSIQGVGAIPYSYKAKIIMPILNKLIDKNYSEKQQKDIEDLVNAFDNEVNKQTIEYGEL